VRPNPEDDPEPAARKRRTRPEAEWIRHCQAHLVHIISCFHERQPKVERHLNKIVRATEELVLAGLPRDALHFTWFKHGKKFGTHSHGGLLRTLLRNGAPYAPGLDSKLRLLFDRLVSRRLGYADPLDPGAFRVVHGAWGSWKPRNHALIRQVCAAATAEWRAGALPDHAAFLALLERKEFGLAILARPARDGCPVQLASPGAGLRVPGYLHTVVVLAENPRRILCFKGPACRSNFSPASRWRGKVAERTLAVAELRHHPGLLFERFSELLQERIARQSALWDGPHQARVGAGDFEWLNQASPQWQEPLPQPGEITETVDPLSPDMDWGDRYYPFVSDAEPELDDVTDPRLNPLRDLIEQEMALRESEAEQAPEPEWDESTAPPTPSLPTESPEITPSAKLPESSPASARSAGPSRPKPPSGEATVDPDEPAIAIVQPPPVVDSADERFRLWQFAEERRRRKLQLQICLQQAQAAEQARQQPMPREPKPVEPIGADGKAPSPGKQSGDSPTIS